ncbi:strawberry notch C-terminal domain-containing protein [Falsiroseomonas tokyonensis]|uniref:Strawberry notch C-terminal domain-containing protein n=1 Tax=Falsiroseomonas tokyonensis TaxID=430521 RepID=A0ABV7BWX4_9PROT|nr:strawberry notch C-terminal domain-containing protein [Falsiroseomonas tokyonensis]MBU8540173.1 strawberry notch C-terminal domain-containing protein [Falsiroseomonas tokyonensis]
MAEVDDWVTLPEPAAAADADDWQTIPDQGFADTRERLGAEAGRRLGLSERQAAPPTPAAAPPAPRRAPNPGMRRAAPIEGFDEPDVPPPPPPAPEISTEFEMPPQAPVSLPGTRVLEGIRALGRVPDRGDLIRDQGQQQRAQIDAIDPQDYAGAPLTYDEATLGQRLGEQLRGGVDAARGGYNLLTGSLAMEELGALDRADRGERLPDNARTPWHEYPPEQRARARASLERRFAQNMRQALQSQQAAAARLRNPRVQHLAEAVDSGRAGDAWRIFASDPAGIIQQLSVESLPHMALPLAGGLAGGLAGLTPGLIGAGMGSLLADAGPRFAEILGDRLKAAGVDPMDGAAVTAFVRANPDMVAQARQDASRGAAVVAGADVASFGTAAGLRRGAGALRNAGRVARNVGIEVGTEGLGEAGAQVASTGEITPSEVLFEMLGAAPQAAGTTAFGTIQEMRRPPAGEAPSAPSRGTQILRETLAPTFESPSPPLVPAGAGTPPPPAAAAPAPASPGAQAAPAGAAAPPDQVAPGVPAAEGSEPAAGPGAGVAAPQQPSAMAGATPPVAPPAAPPPPPGGRMSLEAALAAPSPEVIARQRAADVARWQQQLPQGFTVVEEDGVFSVLDPDGDWIDQTDTPSDAAIAASIEEANGRLQQGLYPQITREGDGTRAAPVQAQRPGDVDAAAGVTAAPTPAQAQAGNYAKGRVRLHGLDVAIETPRGQNRTGVGRDGRPWSVAMPAHYGYFARSEGKDGDEVDVYLGPQAENAALPVFVVDQVAPDTGRFDEHKALMGFPSQQAAEAAYRAAFNDGSGDRRMGAITSMPLDELRTWLAAGRARNPLNPGAIAEGMRWRAEAAAAVKRGEREQRRAERRQREGFEASGSRAPDNLSEFIASRGGLRDDRGDVRFMAGQANPFLPGFGRLIRPTGMAFDRALEAAVESGWMQDGDTITDLLAEIDNNLRGRGVDPETRKGQRQQEYQAEAEAEKYAARLVQIRDMAEQLGAKLRPGEAEAAAAMAAAEEMDIADALVMVLERNLVDAVDEAADAAPEGSEWEIPWDEEAPAAAGPGEAGEGRPEAGGLPDWIDIEPEAGASPTVDGGGKGGGGSRPPQVQTETVRTLDGTGEQSLIPGVAPVTDRDRLGVMADKPLRGGAAPPPAGGLFDPGATQQPDFMDMPGVRQPKATMADKAPAMADSAPAMDDKPALGTEGIRLARQFGEAFSGDRAFASIGQARTFAAGILGRKVEPGTADAKMVDEAAELGVVLAARALVRNGRSRGPLHVYRRLVDLYGRQPRLGTRTSDSIERQAYSTPAPLAWLASELAGITPRSTVLEPTAGTGMLLIGATPDRAVVNELDPERAAALIEQGFRPTSADAAGGEGEGSFAGENVDAVIANPPFGAVRGEDGRTRRFDMSFIQDGYETGEIDHAIALRALEGMADDGRAVLILGGVAKTVTDPQKRADAYNGKAKREFFLTLYRNYRVTDHFTVAGELYAKQGAAWPVDVVVIEGRGRSDRRLPSQGAPRIYSAWDALEEVLNGDRGQPVADAGADAGLGAAGGEPGSRGDRPDAGADGGRPDPAGLPGEADRPGGVAGGAAPGAGGRGRAAAGGARGPRPVAGGRAAAGGAAPAGVGAAGGEPGVAGLSEPGAGPAGENAAAADAGGRGGDQGNQPGAVAGGGVPADGEADLDALFGEVLDEEFGPAPAPAPRAEITPRAGEEPAPRPASTVAASAAASTARGIGDIAAALESILLPKGGKISSNPLFDPEQYSRVLPLLREAAANFREAWADTKELLRRLVQAITQAIPAERRRQFAEALRPYITRFAGDLQAGRETLEDAPEQTPVPGNRGGLPESPAPARRDQPQDEETDRQVAYKPRADANGVGTLVPVNMQTAVAKALERAEQRAGMPLVEFVADRLDYSPDEVRRYFSAEQIDAIALGIHNLDDDAGFVIGDQTGVGKGRFVAAMIRYALKQNLIPVFVTEKPNLYADMARDLTDIGMPDALGQILPTNAGLSLALNDEPDGPRLRTPDPKRHNQALSEMEARALQRDRRIVFTSYSQMQQIAEADTARITFLQRIAPQAFLILDESHNAGDADSKPAGRDRGTIFRGFLSAARSAVYSSATWAKRPDVMDLYGIKTDMRLAVPKLSALANAIATGGVPMQQIVSAMMAESGQYIRRERSFAGVTYDLEPIEVNQATYDAVSRALADIFEISQIVAAVAKEMDKEAKAEGKRLTGGEGSAGAGVESANFGAVMHNLINQLLLASKAPGTARLAIDALKRGEKPVIAVANTMGSFIEEFAEQNNAASGDVLDLTFNSLLNRYLRRQLRLAMKRPFMKKGEKAEEIWLTPESLGAEGRAKYLAAERRIAQIDLEQFPVSPIDYIRSELMRAGYKVGEVTGRTEAADYRADGKVYYRRRPQKETSTAGRLDAIRRFNGGTAQRPLPDSERIDAMILNQSGATGLSLHANATFGDRRRRIMLIAQAEANIDTFMQMLGRVHRTGQVIAPGYLQLVAGVPAEKRPAAVLAKKMASLAAATTANRRGALGAENSPDFMNQYGDEVVARIVEEDGGLWRALGEPKVRDDYDQPTDAARRVTGRIPLLPLARQEEVYAEIEAQYRRAIEQADAQGTNALEAKTLELDAKLLDEKPWTEGKGKAGSLFAGPSVIGRYDVRKQVQPPALDTIGARVAESLGLGTADRFRTMKREEIAAALQQAAGAPADTWRSDMLDQIEEWHAAAASEISGKVKKADTAKKARDRLDQQRDAVTAVVMQITPGNFASVQVGDAFPEEGLVVNLSPPDKGNPLAPGGWDLSVMLEDGRRIETSLAGVFTPTNQPQSGKDLKGGDDIIIRGLVAPDDHHAAFLERLERAAREVREERFIVTGNLLAGFAKRRGQIANFYTAEGDLRQGIILPAGFDPEAFEAAEAPSVAADEAQAFLLDSSLDLPMIETSDGAARIARDTEGQFVMTAPSSKKEGAVWFLNRDLRRAIGDLAGSGKDMRKRFDRYLLPEALRAFYSIAADQKQRVISKTPQAAEWVKTRREGEGRRMPAGGGSPLYSTPFDPAAFRRFLWDPLTRAVGGQGALARMAAAVREENIKVMLRLWRGAPTPAGVTVKDMEVASDLTMFGRYLRTPDKLFRRFPALAALIQQGIRSEQRQSVWITRLTEEYDRIRAALSKGRGDWAKVQATIWQADAEGIDLETPESARAYFDEMGLNPAEARAAGAINRLFVKQARLVDQHRRAMMPKVKARKAEVWRRMQRAMAGGSVPSEEYAKAYRRRTYLTGRIKAGKGDLTAQAAEVEQINDMLRGMRLADPDLQATMTKLQDEYDDLEARLQATSVRRLQGYAPHKFYGSWRLFVQEGVDENGEPIRVEITSDQGFYDSKDRAIAAAADYLRENPDATLTVEPRTVVFPSTHGGATLSDAAYARLRRGLEAAAAEEGITASTVDLLRGVARRRSRRRTFAPGMQRKGAEGFSEDLAKVMRTHIGQTVRYVEMDKLKFAYVETAEAEGLSPTRATSLRLEGKKNLQDALEAWWRDVNGSKQGGEEQIDAWLSSMPVSRSVIYAMTPGLLVGAAGTPITGAAMAGYLGWRMYQAREKGGAFPTRSVVSGITSDMAHLKLGALFNLGSALVNLSQTMVNTFPVLGAKWTGIGVQRAAAALVSQARNQDTPGRMSSDAQLLMRADIRTRFRFAEDNPLLAEAENTIKRLSMLPFETAERLNRAAAYLGAYHRAEARGASPAAAQAEATAILTRTQFHQGNANKPELLRAQWARIPLQFKNFMLQQLGFMFSLRGAEIGRFLLALFLIGGALALPGLQLLDWLAELVFKLKPSDAVAELVADAQGFGDAVGGTVQALARGLPGLFGAAISERVGMGAGFLPDQGSDFTGPAWGTLQALRQAEQQSAQLVDTLTMVSPAAMPLKALEAAANGASITSSRFWSMEGFGDGRAVWTNPRRPTQSPIEPTTGELATRAAGLQPTRWAEQSAVQRRQLARQAERRRQEDRYLTRMIQANREGRSSEIAEIRAEAARAGLTLAPNRIREALRNSTMDRTDRATRAAPRQDRGELQRRMRALDERSGVQ